MINPQLQKALNEQVVNELSASYSYLSISAALAQLNLNGFAKWMREHSEEERTHAMKLFDFILDRGGQIELGIINAPEHKSGSARELVSAALEHEKLVTGEINSLYQLALDTNDYPAQVMLQWFIAEQVEEEKVTGDIVHQLEMAGDNTSALLLLDAKLENQSGSPN